MTSRIEIPPEMIADYFTLLSVAIPDLPEETYVPFNRTIQRCWFTTWDNLKKLRIPEDDERYRLVEFWDKVGSMLEIDTQIRPSGREWIGGTEVIGRVVLAAAVDVVVKVASDRNASLARSKADEGANAR
ncbi:hypothetical protein NLI96_g3263 [Meripilus lineatus]|uniref:Uncharacterized protein n=1 Tax=Meripilus lineatus TaxID=2056292 RepID=A0AAD5YFT2_9APHY|nr:hypothetical protein NLI96_g3263 [Physisporinus lineatus]